MKIRNVGGAAAMGLAVILGQGSALASSHREAPFLTKNPKVDATDFYMFDSYERGREGFVTLIANYLPLQDRYGGPNYFSLDPEALYEILIDNDGDAREDLTFQLEIDNKLKGGSGITLDVGPDDNRRTVAVPFVAVGPIAADKTGPLNVEETYTLRLVRGDRRTGSVQTIKNAANQETTFRKPLDNVGTKTIPDYVAYAAAHVYDIDIPGCTPPPGKKARVFVGQRDDGFAVNLGQIFDLINLNPLGPVDGGLDSLVGKNVTTIALEVPASCLNASDDTVIGGWTAASVRQARVINPRASYGLPAREGGPWAQVSRLGMPLVNEVVIGIKDKDRFNSSEPKDDGQFIDYVTHPALPEIIELLYGATAGVHAPDAFPRTDLVAAFLTGVTGVNATATPSEMLRLNTSLGARSSDKQFFLGAAGCFDHDTLDTKLPACDPTGFPNGRRPGDDVVDIELRVAMGYLLAEKVAPSGQLAITDGAIVKASQFDDTFPYLTTPNPGAP